MMANPAESQHGYMLTGLVINFMLLGLMVAQLYIYYTTYKKDRVWIKVFVAFLFIMDVANSAVIYVYLYRVLVKGFGDVTGLFTTDWVFGAGPATTAIIGLFVQHFFAWRVRILTQKWKVSWVLVGLVSATSVGSAVAGLICSWEVTSRYTRFEQFHEIRHVVIVWLVSSAFCDGLITASLVIALRKQKTGFKRSDLMIDRIIRLAMQTGLVTVVVAVVDMIAFLASLSGLHLVFNYSLSKLYTNSLLSSLNSRRVASHDGPQTDTEDDGYTPSSGTWRRSMGKTFTSSFKHDNDIVNLSRPPRPEVFVHIEEHELADSGKKDFSTEVLNERSSSPHSFA